MLAQIFDHLWRSTVFAAVAIAVGAMAAPELRAQAQTEKPLSFEVASVKPSGGDQPAVNGWMHSTGAAPVIQGKHDIITYTRVTLKGLLMRAYNMRVGEEIAGPSWLGDKYFDIVAKMPKDATAEQVPAMLQTLLAERFGVKVHWETQEEAGYALVVGKNGLKLTRSASSNDVETGRGASFQMSASDVHLSYKKYTLDEFASALTGDLAKPVVNRAGVDGTFDISLDCATASVPAFSRMATSSDLPEAPSIFTAIRGLGLDLVPQKVPTRKLVVDSANPVPTEN